MGEEWVGTMTDVPAFTINEDYDQNEVRAYIESLFDIHGKMLDVHINRAKFPKWVWDKLSKGPYLYHLACGHSRQTTSPKLHKTIGCDACDGGFMNVVTVEVDGVKYPRQVVSEIRRINGGNPSNRDRERITRQRQMKRSVGTVHHRQYRANLIADGCTPELADKATMEYRWNNLQQRAGEERYRRIRERLDGGYRTPNDNRYRPNYVDPLLKGVARATGQTARVIRSGRTITNWQHSERQR